LPHRIAPPALDSIDVCKRAMERYSIIDRLPVDRLSVGSAIDHSTVNQSIEDQSVEDASSRPPGAESELEGLELEVSPSGVGKPMNASVPNPSVSAGIAAANALAAAMPPEAGWRVPRFSGEDGGHSLAEMAQRDLDATLQLLADRAQYITGAGGAAIALRRDERNDMVCCASAGSKAPELGALLSTESGLSGESVRMRMPLRCDDAEHDARVNRESCRDLGIASVMIVPITGENLRGADQVLGVFELFSGEARAFADRDLSALQRLGAMVETAVKLARVAQTDPQEMLGRDLPADVANQIRAERVTPEQTQSERIQKDEVSESASVEDDEAVLEVEMEEAAAEILGAPLVVEAAPGVMASAPAVDSRVPPQQTVSDTPVPIFSAPGVAPPGVPLPAPVIVKEPPVTEPAVKTPAVEQPTAKRPLMWSAAVHASPEAAKMAQEDQSHVPPMLRNLRKCKACGFPVSEGRTLCVECDEKQWRGQPLPSAAAKAGVVRPAVDFRQVSNVAGNAEDSPRLSRMSSGVPPKSDPVAAVTALISSSSASPLALAEVPGGKSSAAAKGQPKPIERAEASASVEPVRSVEQNPVSIHPTSHPASLNFTGGLGTSESWLSANKYILGAILLIAGVVAAVAWLR